MKLFIAGDILPVDDNRNMFEKGEVNKIVGEEILNLASECDLRIVNLEGPITDEMHSIAKSGPCIKANTNTINGIRKLNIDVVSLANNHIMDYGINGFESTISTLQNAGIKYVGAGKTIDDAKKPIIISKNGFRVGIYACAEHEFTIADKVNAGANPFDDLYIGDHIRELKENVDYLVVLYHGMKEFYQFPAPYVKKRCHYLIDKGADFVTCQHSHCIGTYEKYKGKEILYGQGNYVFCLSKEVVCSDGLIVVINTETESNKYIPIRQQGNIVRRLDALDASMVLEEFEKRSKYVQDDTFLQANYEEFSKSLVSSYQRKLLGKSIGLFDKLRITEHYLGFNYPKSFLLEYLNMLQCEAHRDVIKTALLSKIKDGD